MVIGRGRPRGDNMQGNRPLNQLPRSLEIIRQIGRDIKHPRHVAAPTIPLQQPARPRGQLQNLRRIARRRP